ARIHNEVTNGPAVLVDQHSLHVADAAVLRLYVVPGDHPAAAQVRIVILVARRLHAGVRFLGLHRWSMRCRNEAVVSGHQHHAGIVDATPEPRTAPIVWVAVMAEVAYFVL